MLIRIEHRPNVALPYCAELKRPSPPNPMITAGFGKDPFKAIVNLFRSIVLIPETVRTIQWNEIEIEWVKYPKGNGEDRTKGGAGERLKKELRAKLKEPTKPNEKGIKVISKKFIRRGKKVRQIKDIELLDFKYLPDEYTDIGPCVFVSKVPAGRIIRAKENRLSCTSDRYSIHKLPAIVEESEFQDYLAFLNECGDRLMEINKRLHAENKDWKGTEVTVI